MPKVVIGVDPHKRLNAVVVVNTKGVVLARGEFPNTAEGFRELKVFWRQWRPRTWAVEGCNGVGKHLAQRLVFEGERVLDVSTRRAALVRVYAGGNGRKTDDTDAHAIAMAAVHSDDLPEVRPDEHVEALRLLSNRRDEIVALRVQAVCRIHRDLLALVPGGASRSLTAKRAKEILARVRPRDDVGRLRKKLVAAQIADLVAIDRRLAEINQELKTAVAKTSTGLTRHYGVGPVTTARVLGEVGDVSRFRSRHHFASYNGTAPTHKGSGGPPTPRVNTKGNRKLNHAIHLVAVTQIRQRNSEGRAYFLRKVAEGKTEKEAIRALKRKISDVIYRQLVTDAAAEGGPGGHVGTTPKTSVTDLTPMAGSSVKPQPGPRRKTTPIRASA